MSDARIQSIVDAVNAGAQASADPARYKLIARDALGTIASYARAQKIMLVSSHIEDDVTLQKIKMFSQIAKAFSDTVAAIE